MPAGLIDEQRGVCARRELAGDVGQVQLIASVSHLGMTRAAPMQSLEQIGRR